MSRFDAVKGSHRSIGFERIAYLRPELMVKQSQAMAKMMMSQKRDQKHSP